METIIENTNKPYNGKTVAGIIILVFGSLLLVDQFNPDFIPDWIFSWPMWLIAYGIYVGGKYNFTNNSWLIYTLVGLAFLLENTGLVAASVLWPVGIILVGVWMMVRGGKPKWHKAV
jgi:hypothetical protein